jgi:hypothetical protein
MKHARRSLVCLVLAGCIWLPTTVRAERSQGHSFGEPDTPIGRGSSMSGGLGSGIREPEVPAGRSQRLRLGDPDDGSRRLLKIGEPDDPPYFLRKLLSALVRASQRTQ